MQNVHVNSEIGRLRGVIVHSPGPEMENMTPANAERALYSDILNLSIASSEYKQFKGVLDKHAKVYEVKDLLQDILVKDDVKNMVVAEICRSERCPEIIQELLAQPSDELARMLLQGVELEKDNLTNYLSNDRYLLRPLHNFLFTRDASMSFYDEVLVGSMASKVRERESIIMRSIFDHHDAVKTDTISVSSINHPKTTIEGGDVLIARDDVTVIGTGSRTSTRGVDFIIESIKSKRPTKHHILVQELPDQPESFIHLDMVFTFLDKDTCMVYEPLLMAHNRYRTIHITIEGSKVSSIKDVSNLPTALNGLGFNLKTVSCGGTSDEWIQEREQWHSGANFFAIAPGVVIGYQRNVHTIEELSTNGFDVIPATDIIEGVKDIPSNSKAVITIEGSELARGGGGARCMSMPFLRDNVQW